MSSIRRIGRLIAISVIVLFVGLVPIVLLAYNTQAVATSQGFLDSLAGDSRMFEAALSQAAEDLARSVPAEWETHDMPIARINAAQGGLSRGPAAKARMGSPASPNDPSAITRAKEQFDERERV